MPVYLCKPGSDSSEPWRYGITVYSEPFDVSTLQDPNFTGSFLADPATATTTTNNNNNNTIDETFRNHHNYHRAAANTANANERDPPPNQKNAVAEEQHNDRGDSEVDGSNLEQTFQADQLTQTNADRTSTPTTRTSSPKPKPLRRIRHGEVVLVQDVCVSFGNYWLRLRRPGPKGEPAGYICLISSTVTNHANINTFKNLNNAHPIRDATQTLSIDHHQDAQSAQQNIRLNLPQLPEYNSDLIPIEATEEPRAPSPGLYAANSQDQTMRCLRTGIAFPSSPVLQLLQSYDDGLAPPVAIPSEGNPVFCRICRETLHDEDENNKPDGENPLMAPCECSGSMAFVHYLCVEQWRCRSRHPEACNGLNCETCSKPYALAPPTSRPAAEEESVELMPPHVLQGLRNPHLGWQLGTFIVTKRWLRPIAPILVSPVVALYCRARRLLKKRGVSRRRWACSLCRRRARWKCVRCLRSYYCSRQCQNVSWHIVHKHVCYKPARFAWSVVVYSAITLLSFPGILKDPLMYDLLMSIIPVSFYVMAVLGGSTATAVKKAFGVDMRGRILESIVVLLTTSLVWITWGLIWGFFGEPDKCVGVLGSSDPSRITDFLNMAFLRYAAMYFKFWDRLGMKFSFSRTWICNSEVKCFSHVSNASSSYLLENPKCTSDMKSILAVWISAIFALIISTALRRRRRNQVRLHQD